MGETLGVRRKYQIRKFFSGPIATGLILLVLAVSAHAALGMYQKGREAMAKRDAALAELARLEARETELELEIARLSTDRGIEEELRERYLISKEGESVAIVNIEEGKGSGSPSDEAKRGFWKKLLSAIGFSGE